MRVLVVDDNDVNQRVAVLLLKHLGYPADVVADGEQAVAAVLDGAYDLVLMDCQMPALDGLGATRIIREREQGRRTPIVAVTAMALDGERERCLAAGMDGYLAKPLDVKELEATMSSWAERPLKEAGD